MANLSSDGKYVIVDSMYDTLSGIAKKHGNGKTYQQLAAINGISNPNHICIGDKIYLSKTSSSSGSSSSTSKKLSTKHVTVRKFGLMTNADRTLYITWDWPKHSQTENYEVYWEYATGDGVWFIAHTTTDDRQSTYSIPSNATKVRVKIKPISKEKEEKYTVTNKKTKKKETKTRKVTYFTADWNDWKEFNDSSIPPEKPGAPSVKMEQYKLTAELKNLDLKATHIVFQLVKNNKSTEDKTVKIVKSDASYSWKVSAGGNYKVRCRAKRNSLYSDWSDYSEVVCTAPVAPKSILKIKALSETSVQIDWENVSNADTYEIQYTTKKMYFDSSSEVQSTTVDAKVAGHAEITGLTSGERYYFRVRAKNSTGDSAWTPIKEIVLGKPPAAPTTWSSTTTATVGELVTLYWAHNSEDGSSQTYAELEFTVNGITQPVKKIKNTTDEDEKDKTSKYVLDTSIYAEGIKIEWRVRTSGITNKFGDWSTQRTLDIYAPPTLDLSFIDSSGESVKTVTSFPVYVEALAGPNTQVPIGYHFSVISNQYYETVDSAGNSKTVNEGDVIYSKYFDRPEQYVKTETVLNSANEGDTIGGLAIDGVFTTTNEQVYAFETGNEEWYYCVVNDTCYRVIKNISSMMIELSAGNIDLENGVDYTIMCTVAMDSGLSAESTLDFDVSWEEDFYSPNAELTLDTGSYTINIRPYCEELMYEYREVTRSYNTYTITDNVIEDVYGTEVKGAFTETGEQVYSGTTADGDSVYYCEYSESTLVEDVTLSVYRREFDGGFTEIATGLPNTSSITVTDPHPALDWARYRIVATSDTTGAISYYDMPGYPVGGKEIIIQWDEEWSSFNVIADDRLSQPPWSGSLIALPYNIDVSDSINKDVEFVEYAGRKHPVSYYGTHRGEKSTWNTVIQKDDEEMIYALRRLNLWSGDAYVREPSGTGYWASVTVTFPQKHKDLTIPVTFTITRVEGGI